MKKWACAAFTILATFGMAGAQPPATAPWDQPQPAAQATTEPSVIDHMRARSARDRGPHSNDGDADVSATDEGKIADFMAGNSPHRWKAWRDIRASAPGGRPAFSGMLLMRYRELHRLEKDDHELYDIKVREIKAEDDISGMLQEHRHRATTEPADFEATLRDKVTALIQVRIDERKHHLARLQHALEDEQKKVERDEADISQLAQRQTQMMLQPKGQPTTAPSDNSQAPSVSEPKK